MIIEGKLTLKAACGHEITTEFGTVEPAGISRIAVRILRDECPACKFAARRYRLTLVSIDSDNTAALEAYILDNERWNGWVMPWFDRYQMQKYLAWQKQYGGCDEVRFDADKDAVITKLGGEEEADEWSGEDIDVNGRKVHAYGVGAGSWTWQEVI
jgi:hypothetical protein